MLKAKARHVFACFAGLVMICVGADGSAADVQQQRDRSMRGPLSNIEMPLARPPERKATAKPCPSGEIDRGTDLCAQWMSAEATRSSAIAAWLFGALGAVIGCATLVAAILAGKWAKQAALEAQKSVEIAERGLKEAKDSTWYANRPWIAYDTIEQAFVNGGEPLTSEGKARGYDGLEYVLNFKNYGNSPAVNVSTAAAAIFMRAGEVPGEIRFNRKDGGASSHIPQGKMIPVPVKITKSKENNVPCGMLDAVIKKEMDFYVIMKCFYRSTGRPDQELTTEMCAKMMYRGMARVGEFSVPRFDPVPTGRLNQLT